MSDKKSYMEMKGQGFTDGNLWADTDLLLSPEDRILFRSIGEFIRAEADIEGVKNDPLFDQVNDSVREMMTGYDADAGKRISDREYISESLKNNIEEKRLAEEIKEIKLESSRSGINKVASGWVDDWNKKSDAGTEETVKRKELEDFISRSLENKVIVAEHKKVFSLRWILTSAAALTGAIFIIRALLLNGDPDRIFARYYEPMNIVSSVTRDANIIETNSYTQAVEFYKTRNYPEAAAGFSLALEQGIQSGQARFCMALTYIAMENYREAINVLDGVVAGQGEYVKDATWYLGLAYIKTGESGKAKICFETLALTPGFYSDRSGEILRRLK